MRDEQKQQQDSLVVMTNKDTYYVTRSAAQTIADQLQDKLFFEITDSKSRAKIVVVTANISSVIIRGEL